MRARLLGHLAVTSVLVAMSGCTLYFHGSSDDDAPPPPDEPDGGPQPWPDSGGDQRMVRCENGVVYLVTTDGFVVDGPGHGAGQVVGQCPGECRTSSIVCEGGACPTTSGTMCTGPASTGATCALAGSSCSGSSTIECPQTTTCGFSVPGAACSCANGTYQCTPRTDAATIQASIVGKWRGRVTPPSFTQPYDVSLWIYPDGTYWAECSGASCSAFYYGGDGPHPWRKITVLSNSPTAGAWADIGVFTDFNVGALSSLVVSSTKLAFTYNASWHNCGQPFYFNLTRE